MSTRLGATPRTPTNNDRRTKIRRFGTVLSVNSPVTTPSIPPNKKHTTRIRGDALLHLTTIPSSSSHHQARSDTIVEESEDDGAAIPFQSSESANIGTGSSTPSSSSMTTYTVTFDAGPIGLQIDPETWCVKQVIGRDSPAAMIGTIHMGDTVVAVNNVATSKNTGCDGDDIFDVLQDVSTRRTITFQRLNKDNHQHQNGDSSCSPTAAPETSSIVPTNDIENRKPIPGSARLQQAPRSLHFGHHQTTSTIPMDKKTETQTPPLPSSASTDAPSDSIEVRDELMIANHQIQQLQVRLAAMEKENERLRSQQHRSDEPPLTPPSQQQFSAIREMEYNMRIKSLQDQLKHSNESKEKVKEHNKRVNQMLVHQSENHQQALSKKEQELQEVIISSKETMKELERARLELVTTTKQRNDDVDALRRENDQLQAALDQTTIDLERHVSSKAQSDAKIQQLEGKCSDLNDQVQRLRYLVTETENHAQKANDELLQIIRTKDEEMEQLRIEMVNVQTINDKLHTDLTEKDATIRQVRADMEQLSTSKQSFSIEVMNLSSTLEMTYNDKQLLETQLAQVEEKLTIRNNTIESLKAAMKSMQDETAVSLTVKENELMKVSDSLVTASSERDQLRQQLLDIQRSVFNKNQSEMQLRTKLTQVQVELDALRQSSTQEKCDLLKQLNELEGELMSCKQTIQVQADTLSKSSVRLDTMTAALSQLDINRIEVVKANTEIQRLEMTIAELNEQASTNKMATEQLQTQLIAVTDTNAILQTSNQRLSEGIDAQHGMLMSACLTELQLRFVQKQHRTKIGKLNQLLHREKKMLQKECSSLQIELSSTIDQLTSLTLERDAALSKVATLELDLRRNISTSSVVESALEAAVIRNIQLEVQYQRFAETAILDQQRLNDKCMASEQQSRNSLHQYTDLQATNKTIAVKLEQMNETSELQKEDIVRLTAQLATTSAILVEIKESTRLENDALHERIRTTEKAFDDTLHRLERAEKSYSEATSELASSRTLVDNLSFDLSNLQTEFKEYQSIAEMDRAEFRREKKLTEDKVLDLTLQLNQQTLHSSQCEDQLQILQDEVCELNKHLTTKDEELSEKDSEMHRISAMLEKVSSDLQTTESYLSNTSIKAENAELTIVEMKESMALQTTELEAALKLVTNLESENEKLMTEISRTNTETAHMTTELQHLAATKQADDKTIEELKDAMMALQSRHDSDCAVKDLNIEEMTRERDDAVVECFRLRDNIDKGKDRESMLQSEVDQLRFQLTNAEADFQKSDELFSGQASELAKFQRKFTEQKTRADKLLLELQQSESSIDSLSRFLDSTNAQVSSLKQSLASKTNEFENKLDAVTSELNNSLKINQTLMDKNSEFLENISKLEAAYSNAKETADILTRKLSTSESKLSVAVATASANDSKFILQQELLQRDITNLNSLLAVRGQQIFELTEKHESAEEEKAKLASQLSEITAEVKRVSQDLSSVQMQLDESRQHETAVVAKINETWSSTLDDMYEKNRVRLLADNEKTAAVEKEHEALQSVYNTTMSEMQLLKEAICDMEAKNAALSKGMTAFERDIADRNALLNASEKLVHEKSRQLIRAENSIVEANIQISDLEARIEKLLHESSTASNAVALEISQLKEAYELAQVELNKIEIERNTLQLRLSDKDFELESIHEKLRVQTEATTGLTASTAASQWILECKIEALNAEVQKYRELSSDLNAECNDLKSKVDSFHERIDSMNDQHSSTVSNLEIVNSTLSEQKNELSENLSIERNRTSQLTDQLHKLKLERSRELSELCSNKRQLEETIRLLQLEADLKSQRQEDWMKDRESERAQFYESREELQQANIKVSNLESSVAEIKAEVASLILQAEQAGIEYESNMEQLTRSHAAEKILLQEDNDKLRSDIAQTSSKTNSLTERLRILEEQLAALQSEQNGIVAEKKDLMSLIEEKNASIQALKSELENRNESSCDEDAVESPSKSLSKSELKHRFLVLQGNLINTENRLKASDDAVNRRSHHVDQLVEDMNAMSDEISRLVTANEMLEARLKEVSSHYSVSEESITKAHKAIDGLQTQLKNKSEKLDEMSSLNESLVDQLQLLKMQSKSDMRSIENEKNTMNEELLKTKQDLINAVARRDRAEKSLSDNQLELVSARKNEEYLSAAIKQLEQEVKNNMGVTDSTIESNTELSNKLSYSEEQVSNLQTECTKLRARISQLQLEIESNNLSLKDKAETERLLSEDISRQRQNVVAADRQREAIVAKLTEATRVVTSQRTAIKKLESSATESERRITELTERIVTLQTTNQHREIAISENDIQRNELLRDLRTKLNILDETRAAAVQEANNTRVELRKVQQDLSESERANLLLQKQLKDLSIINDLTKTEIVDARNSRDDAKSSLRKLTNELDDKQMEIDHLKAKVQVSTATAARLKANVLLQESTHQTISDGDVESKIGEIVKLKDELNDNSSKLASILEVCKSQEQALSHSQKLESQLVRFIEEIISEMDNVLGKIARRTESLYEYADQYQVYTGLESLDLAGFDRADPNSETLRVTLDSLSVLIPRAATQLDERRAQLGAWKEQRTDQYLSHSNTPKTKRLDVVPATPEILDTLHRMRNFLKTDILSPIKIRTLHSDQLDMEFFKQVIHTLEGNIDVLLQDLQAANTALQEKDDRISELETLISFRESVVANVETLSKHQDKTNSSFIPPNKNEDDSHDEGSQSTQGKRSDFDGRKLAAGRLLLHALEGRTNAAKAVAFRRWSCQTSAMRAIAKHGHTATALAQQLEETREKLLILKRHLKKARRTGNGGSSNGGGAGGTGTLDCIPEGENEV